MRQLFALPFLLSSVLVAAAPPPLPEGLQEDKKTEERQPKQTGPSLPPGLAAPSAPPLPQGLGESTSDKERENQQAGEFSSFMFSGFAETRMGLRLQSDPAQKSASIAETRLQLSAEKEFSFFTAALTADFLYDPILDSHSLNLESGNGWLDLREASALVRPTSFLDLKLGRQILTWGTGDLLFINDLFPKDWNAFFIGRDTEYLKAPSDAAKLALFSDFANLDVVYTPRFDADRFLNGERLSYFNPLLGDIAGRNAPVQEDRPESWFRDDEIALRLYRNLGAAELALYFYEGFWKSPAGQDASTGLATFPRLRTWGASVRRPLLGGIANTEFGFYDSLDDPNGTDPFVNNSEFRLLAGIEREIAPDFTAAMQYYLEYMQDYGAYLASLPNGFRARDKARHVITARFTKLAKNQTLIWSLFAYYSPSDKDAYLRPKVSYKLTDAWLIEAGANIFIGAENHTFFGQFERNNNLFSAVRYSF